MPYQSKNQNKNILDICTRGRIFSRVRPSYEQAVSDLDRSMHISLWFQVTHSSFIKGSHTTKNMFSGHIYEGIFKFIFCLNQQVRFLKINLQLNLCLPNFLLQLKKIIVFSLRNHNCNLCNDHNKNINSMQFPFILLKISRIKAK